MIVTHCSWVGWEIIPLVRLVIIHSASCHEITKFTSGLALRPGCEATIGCTCVVSGAVCMAAFIF